MLVGVSILAHFSICYPMRITFSLSTYHWFPVESAPIQYQLEAKDVKPTDNNTHNIMNSFFIVLPPFRT